MNESEITKANAHPCTVCGMLADIDPEFHMERYAHAPKMRDNMGTLKVWRSRIGWATIPTL